MNKTIMALIMMVALAQGVMAWEFNAFGYKVKYQPVQDFTGNAVTPETPQISTIAQPMVESQLEVESVEFRQDIAYLNGLKEVQATLKELDYRRIGVQDMDTGKPYTIHVSDSGYVSKVTQGYDNPQVNIQASFSNVREGAMNNDFERVKNNVAIPFNVKMKLLMMKVF